MRWYLALLPMAKRRTELWFAETDSAGRNLSAQAVHGAFFMETCAPWWWWGEGHSTSTLRIKLQAESSRF